MDIALMKDFLPNLKKYFVIEACSNLLDCLKKSLSKSGQTHLKVISIILYSFNLVYFLWSLYLSIYLSLSHSPFPTYLLSAPVALSFSLTYIFIT